MNKNYYVVFIAVTAVVLSLQVGASQLMTTNMYSGGNQTISLNEYNKDRILPNKTVNEGEINVKTTRKQKTVLIDKSHRNGISSKELKTLEAAYIRAGFKVKEHKITTSTVTQSGPPTNTTFTTTTSLATKLKKADVYIVADPNKAYTEEEIKAVNNFVKDGGYLIMISEPVHGELIATRRGVRLVSEQSKLTTLSSEFGLHFGTEYLYNTNQNDGNYRNIIVSGEQSRIGRNIDKGVFYTAVEIENGNDVITTVTDDGESKAVVATSNNGHVIAIGDSTFLHPDRRTVADNEKIIENIINSTV